MAVVTNFALSEREIEIEVMETILSQKFVLAGC